MAKEAIIRHCISNMHMDMKVFGVTDLKSEAIFGLRRSFIKPLLVM